MPCNNQCVASAVLRHPDSVVHIDSVKPAYRSLLNVCVYNLAVPVRGGSSTCCTALDTVLLARTHILQEVLQIQLWRSVIGNQENLPALAIRGQFDVSLGQFQAGSNKLKLDTLVTEYLNLGSYNKCSIWREGDHVLQGLCVCIYNLQAKTQDAEQPINNSSVYENRPAATVHHLIHISCLCTE